MVTPDKTRLATFHWELLFLLLGSSLKPSCHQWPPQQRKTVLQDLIHLAFLSLNIFIMTEIQHVERQLKLGFFGGRG